MSGEKPESAAVSVPQPKAREIAVRIVRIALADFQNKHIPSNEVEERAVGWGFANIQSALDAARDEQREKDARQWQPIETAPKDGGEMLLRVKMRAGIRGKTLVGHYMPGGHCIEDHPPIAAGWYFWNGLMFDKAAEPTHWMPLPEGPR